MPYESFPVTSVDNYGYDVSLSNAYKKETYINENWEFENNDFQSRLTWSLDSDNSFPYLQFKTPAPTISFPVSSSDSHGVDVSPDDIKSVVLYESAGFVFRDSLSDWTVGETDMFWSIDEGVSYPELMQSPYSQMVCGEVLPGTPLTAKANLITVFPDYEGSMAFGDAIYKYSGTQDQKGNTTGSLGDTITFEYFGNTILINGVQHQFLASGVTDPDACGGFSGYTTETSRTVPFYDDKESVVNFYYIVSDAEGIDLTQIHEIKIQTPTGIVTLPVYQLLG